MADYFSPAHASHSIDYVAASVAFSDRMKGDEWLPILEEAIACARELELSTYHDLIGGFLNANEPPVDANAPASLTLNALNVGAGFSRNDASGQRLRAFQVSRMEIKIESTSYVRWAGFFELVEAVLSRLIPRFPSRIAIAQIRLEYRDRYLHKDAAASPSWGLVLKPGDLLTMDHVRRSEPWHLYTGWFEHDEARRRRLVNLNIDARDEPGTDQLRDRSILIYSLVSTLEPPGKSPILKNVLADFDGLHIRSKELLASVLTPEMQERISLSA